MRHTGCKETCLKILEDEEEKSNRQKEMFIKFRQYQSNAISILDKEFLKTYYFGPSSKESEKQGKFPPPEEKI